ncbi:unnamed protein product, partial [Ectocarpus sp. 12 AP-2014]
HAKGTDEHNQSFEAPFRFPGDSSSRQGRKHKNNWNFETSTRSFPTASGRNRSTSQRDKIFGAGGLERQSLAAAGRAAILLVLQNNSDRRQPFRPYAKVVSRD